MNKELQLVEQLSPGASIEAYTNGVFRIPILNKQEELKLLEDFINNNNVDSARKLILSHLRFVIYIARGYLGYGLPLADIIQEGNIGLMKSLQKFDLKFKVRLTTFAVHWIKAEIHDYILKNWRIVKVATTRSQRKLFFKLRGLNNSINWMNDGEVAKIAKDLAVSEADVREMELRLSVGDSAFDGDDDDDENEGKSSAPIYYLSDERYNPSRIFESSNSESFSREEIEKSLNSLDNRSKSIIIDRWLSDKKLTLRELSAKYKVSMERIRQIEETAFKKISKNLAHLMDEIDH